MTGGGDVLNWPSIRHSGSVTKMPNPLPAVSQESEAIPERDIAAMLAMIDYLIAEISKIDPTCAQCLILARKSLSETVGDALVRSH